MSDRNNRVSDVGAVLKVMRNEFSRRSGYWEPNELRKYAVEEVAEVELQADRFIDYRSARNSIQDACTRRLKPDGNGTIRDFEKLAEEWLRQNSMDLKNILLNLSKSPSQQD